MTRWVKWPVSVFTPALPPGRFAVLLEVAPLPCDVGAGMKYDDALIQHVARRVLLYHAHDATDELNEGRQVAEDAEYRRDGQQRMVKALAQLAHLHDNIELVPFELPHNSLIGGTVLARMNVTDAAIARGVRFDDPRC